MGLFRIGNGYDVHRLVNGRKLILAGVEIPFQLGLLGHSDADVLTHSIIDSMLGAAALGDIGKIFPDCDEKYRDISSLHLLKNINGLILEKGYGIGNIDTIIVAQKPKLSPYINQMRENIAASLDIEVSQISIKATTEEGLGFTGTSEGISAHAVCILEKGI